LEKIKTFLARAFVGTTLFSYLFLKKYITFHFWNPLFLKRNIPSTYTTYYSDGSLGKTVLFGDEITFAFFFLVIGSTINFLFYRFLQKEKDVSTKICLIIQLIILAVFILKLYTSKFFALF
jgi:hypothetical protein